MDINNALLSYSMGQYLAIRREMELEEVTEASRKAEIQVNKGMEGLSEGTDTGAEDRPSDKTETDQEGSLPSHGHGRKPLSRHGQDQVYNSSAKKSRQRTLSVERGKKGKKPKGSDRPGTDTDTNGGDK